MTDEPLHVLSLGAGVQSSTMALMAAAGEITPTPSCAIFADTGWEPETVMTWLDWLETQLPFPVYRVSNGNIRDMLVASERQKLFAVVPFFLAGGGMGRRQCTAEYKITPINRRLRELLGKSPTDYIKAGSVHLWMGISTDEATRMKPARVKYIKHTWPLIDAGMSRGDCLRWFERNFPGKVPAKSACIGCPFRSDEQWREMKIERPAEFADAVEVDHAIRMSGQAVASGIHQQRFTHRSRVPLDEVDFRNLEDHGQINLFENECEGLCGV